MNYISVKLLKWTLIVYSLKWLTYCLFFSITEYLNLPASLVAQIIKNLPAMQETLVQFLGQEDPLEKGMATHSNILAWKIPWREESDGLQSMGLQRVRRDWATFTKGINKEADFIKREVKGFPDGSVAKNLLAIAGDIGLIPCPGRSNMPQST